MKNLNFKNFIIINLVISVLVLWVIARVRTIDLSDIWLLLKQIPDVAFVIGLIFALFAKWGWKLKIFQGWLVSFPDLNGTWQGIIKTTWINPKTNTIPEPIPVILTIKQTFIYISCVMRTAEMVSYSFAEEFRLDSGNQIKQIVYSYASNPKLTVGERSVPHYGTIILDIIGTPERRLKGQYWTARKSTGEVELSYREKKLLEDLPDNFGVHPMAKKV